MNTNQRIRTWKCECIGVECDRRMERRVME